MKERRTTVVARDEDLALLAHERADELRQNRRPRLATFRADTSIAVAAEQEQPAARDFRSA
jgi:hypothetical protein